MPRKAKAKPAEKIVFTKKDPIYCPYCHKKIADSHATEEHGQCRHLVSIHLPNFRSDRPDFSKDAAFTDWWHAQPWNDLYEDRDDDPPTVAAFGHDKLTAQIVRFLRAYEACPHIDVLIAQEDQGYGPFWGSIGPVLFGFRRKG